MLPRAQHECSKSKLAKGPRWFPDPGSAVTLTGRKGSQCRRMGALTIFNTAPGEETPALHACNDDKVSHIFHIHCLRSSNTSSGILRVKKREGTLPSRVPPAPVFFPLVLQEQQVTWLAQEIGSGSFERSVTFPKPIDSEKIATQYTNGLLMIAVPLHESSRPRRISVTASEPKPVAVEAGRR
jgi:Hsp20/alpha crystallin family